MIKNQLDNNENKKDQLFKLTVRILRQEAKKLSVPLYSRKNKALLVDLIMKYQKKALIEDQTNNDRELYFDNNFKVNSEGSKNIIPDEDSNFPLIKFTMKINIGTWARPPIMILVSE